MFDFQQLKSMANQVSELSHQRHQQAQKSLEIALQALEKFEHSGFQNAQLAKKASQSLILALRANPQDMRPLLALIYLFALVGDYDTAQLYVALAQGINPDDAYLALLQDFCRTIKPGRQAPTQNVDFHSLFSQTDQAIQDLLSQLHQTPIPKPTLDDKAFAALESSWKQLQHSIQTLAARLEILEQKENTSEMQRSMHVLNQLASRQEKCLKTSQIMRAVYQKMAEQISQANQSYIQVKNSPSLHNLQHWETHLEHQFDSCDQIADQMDDLESQQVKIDGLLPTYHRLLGIIESFGELLDERKDCLPVSKESEEDQQILIEAT